MIELERLPVGLQARYYEMQQEKKHESEVADPEPERLIERKGFDEYSEEERQELSRKIDMLQRWQAARSRFATAAEADDAFIGHLKFEDPACMITRDKLYRLLRAYRDENYAAMLDGRGGWNRGRTGISDEAWNAFLLYYLDQRQYSVSYCYAMAQEWIAAFYPEQLADMPSERSFRRRLATLPEAVKVLGREGSKALDDRCAPYIQRMYDQLDSNDYWIADNHTLDIKSIGDSDGQIHRMSLTAFIDARSGVITGWNLTEQPCSQSTLLALRHGIMRFGIPKAIYVDNGREFLCRDIGGLGHRQKKSTSMLETPPPVFARLNIDMRNALPYNAKAKPIERTFYTLKEHISKLFDGYCGGNPLERPADHKEKLRSGHIHLDSRMRDDIAALLDEYNTGAYGGSVMADRGKPRIKVWGKHIVKKRIAAEEDLSLMLMRSTSYQQVKRNGVFITVAGEKLWYWNENTWRHFGKKVYVRYDEADLAAVRIYDGETDRYMETWPMAEATRLLFADAPDRVAAGIEAVRAVKRAVKHDLKAYKEALPAEQRIDALDLRLRSAHKAAEGMIIPTTPIYEIVRADERPGQHEAVAVGEGVVIDMQRMNRNAAMRRGNKR